MDVNNIIELVDNTSNYFLSCFVKCKVVLFSDYFVGPGSN